MPNTVLRWIPLPMHLRIRCGKRCEPFAWTAPNRRDMPLPIAWLRSKSPKYPVIQRAHRRLVLSKICYGETNPRRAGMVRAKPGKARNGVVGSDRGCPIWTSTILWRDGSSPGPTRFNSGMSRIVTHHGRHPCVGVLACIRSFLPSIGPVAPRRPVGTWKQALLWSPLAVCSCLVGFIFCR